MTGFLAYLFAFIFGAIVGSFLNVVILRYNTGEGLRGRSRCFSCRHPLAARDLIPILSFITHRGRCRFCGSHISWQYPLVELLTGVTFTFLIWRFSGQIILPIFLAYIVSLLLVITVYDFRHKIIPDGLVYLFIATSFLHPLIKAGLAGSFTLLVIGILHSLLSGAVFYFIFWAFWRVSHGAWMGLGDAKLAAGIGILLGLERGFTALVMGFWLGAIIGLLLLASSRLKSQFLKEYFTFKSEVPFAPFLVAGVILTIIFDLNVVPF